MTGTRGDAPGAGPVGVVLAAGPGSRFGGAKQLAELGGRPLLAHAVAPLAAAGLPIVVVVAPPFGDAVRAARPAWDDGASPIRVLAHPGAGDGIGASLAGAAASIGPRDLVVVLGDQPGIEVAWVHAVVAALAAGAPAARIAHPDAPGHPVGFCAQLHGALVGLGPETGQDLFSAMGGTTIPADAPRPPDVDTPADLQDLGA